MATEVEDDPLAAMLNKHLERMQEIADAGFSKTQEVCGDVVSRLKKASGLRDAVLDRTLEKLGIKPADTIEKPEQ